MQGRGFISAWALVVVSAFTAGAQTPVVQTAQPDPSHPILSRQFQADIDAITGMPLTDLNRFRLLENGSSSFPEKLALIQGARANILFTTMVAGWDTSARQFADALVAASARGVEVLAILDGQRTDPRFARALRRGGVEIATWNPFPDVHTAGRIHKKVVVADLATAITGGQNMKDEYNLGDGFDPQHYLDTDVWVQGECATQIAQGFLDIFLEIEPQHARAQMLRTITQIAVTPAAGPLQVAAGRYVLQHSERNELFVDDYYERCFNAARHQIVWHVHAVIGNDPLTGALKDAAARGVNVIFLTSSLRAEQQRLGWLIGYFKYHGTRLLFRRKFRGTGIQIWEMDVAIHSKVLTVDGVMASIGSYNLSTSTQKNIENALISYDPLLVRDVEDMFQRNLLRAKRADW